MTKTTDNALLIYGGPIVTMHAAKPQVEAVAVLHGRIIWTGNLVDIPHIPGIRWKRVDLHGCLMIPAFCDAHTHFVYTALGKTRISLAGTQSLAAAGKRIQAELQHSPKKGWVQGSGFNVNDWPEGEIPHKKYLAAIIPDRPAVFSSKDEHALWVNSQALRKAGITAETPDPEGGVIHRDPESGEPTGYLTENACRLVRDVIPPPSQARQERLVRDAFLDAYREGVTSIHDVGSDRSFAVFQSLYLKKKLQLRVLHALPVETMDGMAASGFRSGLGDELLRIGALKVFLDGALGSHTAHLKRPYTSERSSRGVSVFSADEFTDLVGRAFRAGWAIAVHAIGDAAVRRALDGFLKHVRRRPKAIASRIEHAQLIDPDDLADFARCGIVASMQPSHLLTDRDTAIKHWGTRRARWSFPFRSLLNERIPLVFGSDTPIERLRPLEGIHAAVNRSRPGDERGPWTRAEVLSVYDTVYGFTVAAAEASGEQDTKGTVSPGKVADFAVLSDNIFETERANIMQTSVIMTVFNGRVVYSAL